MRDLAKIVSIKELMSIEGKDRIELAAFNENMYRVIVQKGFKPNDLCVFVEADSLLPNDDKYEFLKARCFKECLDRYLIKPMKMAGHISMGIVFDMSFLPKRSKPYKAGEDVTDVLGITKYEPVEDASPKRVKTGLFHRIMWGNPLTRPIAKLALRLTPKQNNSFPIWLIPKSDETNLQDCSYVLEQFKNVDSYVSIKMEGQSATYLYQPSRKWYGKTIGMGRFTVCSRNNAYFDKKAMPHLFELADRYDISEKLKDYFDEYGVSLALQGEVCGPKIQKNVYEFKANRLFVYKIRNLNTGKDLPFEEIIKVIAELNRLSPAADKLEMVPILTCNTLGGLALEDYRNAEQLCHNGFKIPFDDHPIVRTTGKKNVDYRLHEGVVVRGMNNEFSFKIKDAEYAFDFSGKD